MTKTIRMTVAQAIVKFLDNQYVSMDGEETKFVEGFFTIFGHGIAVGLGEALDTNPGQLRVLREETNRECATWQPHLQSRVTERKSFHVPHLQDLEQQIW